jgi:hypothetical protein
MDIEIIAFIERSPWVVVLIVSEFDLGVHASDPKFGFSAHGNSYDLTSGISLAYLHKNEKAGQERSRPVFSASLLGRLGRVTLIVNAVQPARSPLRDE